MKNILIPILLLTFFTSCDVRNTDKATSNGDVIATQVTNAAPTTVQLLDSVYDFGKIKEGSVVEYSYRFKNTGTNPLVITDAVGSCGCTVPEKPEQPVLPGETGYMKVKFNSDNRAGMTHKTVTVTANVTGGFPELVITGEVLPKDSGK